MADSPSRPRYEGARLTFCTDNGWSSDRYAVHFANDSVLVIWQGASHSAWSTPSAPLPHLAGPRVPWTRLPAAVRAEVLRRCDEVDALPIDHNEDADVDHVDR